MAQQQQGKRKEQCSSLPLAIAEALLEGHACERCKQRAHLQQSCVKLLMVVATHTSQDSTQHPTIWDILGITECPRWYMFLWGSCMQH